ncbi:MAG: hypothetical protein R3B90_02510 [Planctomycetaceae bacterium]
MGRNHVLLVERDVEVINVEEIGQTIIVGLPHLAAFYQLEDDVSKSSVPLTR